MAGEVFFSRQPKRGDPAAHMVVQKNATDFANEVGPDRSLPLWYPPFWPRREDRFGSIVVQDNLQDLIKYFSIGMPFFFQYTPRRDDPNAAIIVQKNLEYLAKAVV